MNESIVQLNSLRVDLSHAGRSLRVLNDISLKIKRGSILAVVGPSGCGKSTFLRAIAGLVSYDGTIEPSFVGDSNLPIPPISMAFQSPVLLPWLTVSQNALLPYRVHGLPVPAEVQQRLTRLLFAVQLFGFRDALPSTLSGGMQMRAALLRAFMTMPELILMDEPFAALDEVTRDHLNHKLLDLWSDEACTIVLVTHNIREALYLADRIVVFSSRPARIIDDRPIPFERPRTPALRQTPAFNALVSELYDWISHE